MISIATITLWHLVAGSGRRPPHQTLDLSASARMSPSARCGHDAASALGGYAPIATECSRSKSEALFRHRIKLIESLSRKAISTVPELANRTPFALVVDTFLMRTADYCVSHRNREHSVLLDKFQYLPVMSTLARMSPPSTFQSRTSCGSVFWDGRCQQRPSLPGLGLDRRTQSSQLASPEVPSGSSCAGA